MPDLPDDEQEKADPKGDLLVTLAYNLQQIAAELATLRSQDASAIATEYCSVFGEERGIDARIQGYRNAIRIAIGEIVERKNDSSLGEPLRWKYLPDEPDIPEGTTESA